MKKKNILFIFCAILVSLISIRVTTAYLTHEVGFSNTYSIGNVKIVLDETDVDELGVPIENAMRVQKNKYHLMPGYTYVKDPIITVKSGSSDSYVRILVTINKIEELKKIFGNDFKPEMLVNGWDNEVWKSVNIIENTDNSNTYEFRYYKIVSGFENERTVDKKLEPLFKSFTLPKTIDDEQLETIKDLEITIVGQAIQTQGFDSEDIAWKSFD